MKRTPFGQILLMIRSETCQSMREMAKNIGSSPSFLSAVELDRRKPNLRMLNAILRSYKLSTKTREALEIAYKSQRGELFFKVKKVYQLFFCKQFIEKFNDLDAQTLEEMLEVVMRPQEEDETGEIIDVV